MVYRSGDHWRALLPLAEIPMTLGGAASHNVANALGAAGLAAALGIRLEAIATGLRDTRREDHP